MKSKKPDRSYFVTNTHVQLLPGCIPVSTVQLQEVSDIFKDEQQLRFIEINNEQSLPL